MTKILWKTGKVNIFYLLDVFINFHSRNKFTVILQKNNVHVKELENDVGSSQRFSDVFNTETNKFNHKSILFAVMQNRWGKKWMTCSGMRIFSQLPSRYRTHLAKRQSRKGSFARMRRNQTEMSAKSPKSTFFKIIFSC